MNNEKTAYNFHRCNTQTRVNLFCSTSLTNNNKTFLLFNFLLILEIPLEIFQSNKIQFSDLYNLMYRYIFYLSYIKY